MVEGAVRYGIRKEVTDRKLGEQDGKNQGEMHTMTQVLLGSLKGEDGFGVHRLFPMFSLNTSNMPLTSEVWNGNVW